MDDAFLLAELQRHLAAIPRFQYGVRLTATDSAWLGKAVYLVEQWNEAKVISFRISAKMLDSSLFLTNLQEIRNTMSEAITELEYKVGARPSGTVFKANTPASFHSELKGILGLAQSDLFLVDAYLTEEVYPFFADIPATVIIRLLTRPDLPASGFPNKKLPGLKAIQSKYVSEYSRPTEIRVTVGPKDIHDRLIFRDGTTAFLSGQSFKDGAKNAPTSLMEFPADLFQEKLAIHEGLWKTAQPI
jgi:hypothetical protein